MLKDYCIQRNLYASVFKLDILGSSMQEQLQTICAQPKTVHTSKRICKKKKKQTQLPEVCAEDRKYANSVLWREQREVIGIVKNNKKDLRDDRASKRTSMKNSIMKVVDAVDIRNISLDNETTTRDDSNLSTISDDRQVQLLKEKLCDILQKEINMLHSRAKRYPTESDLFKSMAEVVLRIRELELPADEEDAAVQD
jgi:hypothetical protein